MSTSCNSKLMLSTILVIFLFGIGFVVLGQKRVFKKLSQSSMKCSVGRFVVSSKSPMVYLSFVAEKAIHDDGKLTQYLLFKITNNTCSPIVLDMSGGQDGLGDASLYYEILDSKTGQPLPDSKYCHVCSRSELGSGQSVTFPVPKGGVEKKLRLSLDFEFGWQPRLDVYSSSWTRQTVQFALDDLPNSAK